MIIHTDYDDGDSKSAGRFRLNCLISTRGPRASQSPQIWTACNNYKEEETSKKAPLLIPPQPRSRTPGGQREKMAPFCCQSCTYVPEAAIYTYSHPVILWIRLALISRTWAPWICHSPLPRKRSGLLLGRLDFTGRHLLRRQEVGLRD